MMHRTYDVVVVDVDVDVDVGMAGTNPFMWMMCY